MLLGRAICLVAGTTVLAAFLAGCAGRGRVQKRPPAPAAPAAAPSGPPPQTVQTPVPPGQVVHPIPPASSADTLGTNILAWDSTFETYRARPGETNADFAFGLRNVSREPLTIYDTSTSCDCTVARLPATPWLLPPDGTGRIRASVDLRYKTGAVTNYVIVFTSKGNKLLLLKTVVPGR